MNKRPPQEVLGQRLVAVCFGPAVAILALATTIRPVPAWLYALSVVNVLVAASVWRVRSAAVRELGAGWLVMSSFVAPYALWTS
jgi:hypothetical protein